MLSLTDYLNEGRDAPLYHATKLEYAAYIISQDMMKAKTRQVIQPTGANPKERAGWSEIKGASFTRQQKYAEHYMKDENQTHVFVIFEVDQRKLTQRNRIVPVNYESLGHKQHDLGYGRSRKQSKEHTLANEYEEFVIGDVKNFDSMVKKIIIPNEQTMRAIHDLIDYDDIKPESDMGKLVFHKKLVYRGQFINQQDVFKKAMVEATARVTPLYYPLLMSEVAPTFATDLIKNNDGHGVEVLRTYMDNNFNDYPVVLELDHMQLVGDFQVTAWHDAEMIRTNKGIPNLKRYLKRVLVNLDILDRRFPFTIGSRIVKTHPLTYDIKSRKFINDTPLH